MRRYVRGLCLGMIYLAAASGQIKIPASAYLAHLIVTNPEGKPAADAVVSIDDTEVGVTDEGGEFYVLRRPGLAGVHWIAVSMAGFTAAKRPVEFSADAAAPGEDYKLQLGVERQPPTSFRPGGLMGIRGSAPRKDPNYEIVRIFYATDRQDTKSTTPALRYANDRSRPGVLARGTCDVTIPRDHRLGSLEEPSLLRLEFHADPEKHVMLKSVNPLDVDPFYEQLNAKVARSNLKEAVVFIHGYNVSFEDAARRTAQLAYDLGFDGAPVLYSWPSRNRMIAYTEDEDSVQWTAFHLRAFLEELAQRTKATKIHLIAHSMGNRALASALQVIAAERRNQGSQVFRQIVLAAPDIGADTVELLAREIQPLARRITLYASAYDDALLVSKIVHGVLRAGQTGAHLMVVPGIDTVDASGVKTDFLGHSYYGQSDSIVSDIRKILTTERPPDQRDLLPAEFQGNLRYWIIPPVKPATHGN